MVLGRNGRLKPQMSMSVAQMSKREDSQSGQRVTGIGGIFMKARDPAKLMSWYHDHLGVKLETPDKEGTVSTMFAWREEKDPKNIGYTVWGIFPHHTKYFGPASSQFMINFRVKNLQSLLAQLRKEGVHVDEKVEELDYGKFGWIIDPEGNRIELWEPKG